MITILMSLSDKIFDMKIEGLYIATFILDIILISNLAEIITALKI